MERFAKLVGFAPVPIEQKKNLMRTSYTKFKGFENIYLEDSFVLEIIEKPKEIKFIMDLVLTTLHKMYSKPKPNEVNCYKKGEILFSNLKEINWIEKTLIPSKDASGEIDFGNIDVLYFDKDFYYLSGGWGELRIESSEPQIQYL